MGFFAYYDGVYYKDKELRLPLTDRAIWFGDGVYDVAMGESGRFHLLSEHLSRFLGNARRIELSLPYSEQRLCAVIETLCDGMTGTLVLYMQATRSSAVRIHAPDEEGCHLLVTVRRVNAPVSRSLSLVGIRDVRSSMCDIKSLNLLPNVLAAREAKAKGADEAVLLFEDTVREGSHSSVSILRGDVLYTHPTDCHILPGVMRARLLKLARQAGVTVRECPFSVSEMLKSDGVLVTSTTTICRIGTRYDGEPLPSPSPLALSLSDALWRDYSAAVYC